MTIRDNDRDRLKRSMSVTNWAERKMISLVRKGEDNRKVVSGQRMKERQIRWRKKGKETSAI